MKTFMVFTTLTVLSLGVMAETLTPLKGQSATVIQQDISACQAQAGRSPANNTRESNGGRARGAVTGAVAGAAVGEVRGNRYDAYDRLDDDVKQEYRQNKARDGAVAGAVVGGARQRQARRESSQTAAASSSAYNNCMQQRGYQLTP